MKDESVKREKEKKRRRRRFLTLSWIVWRFASFPFIFTKCCEAFSRRGMEEEEEEEDFIFKFKYLKNKISTKKLK